jgi:threonine synthase
MRRVPREAVGSVPRFVSTRDPARRGVSLAEAVRIGLARDGGLFVPSHVPVLDPAWLDAETWPDLVSAVLRPWLEPVDAEDWLADARAALDFPVPLRPLQRDRYLLELFHGPTLAFKDVAARTMARWWGRTLTAAGERATVLVATSGDTGSAVADGFAGVDGLRVAVLYPARRVSTVQERQLIARRPGVMAFAVEGTFDDCQRLVKAALVDPGLASLRLSTANSINVGRLLPQTTYYAWAWLQLARLGAGDERPLVSVPSGNLGNLTAGLLAAAMGVPVGGFVAAHNANDYFPRYLGGEVAPFAYPPTVATVANAMDVGAPSNFERLHALFADGWPVPLSAAVVDDEAALARLGEVWREDGRLVCPHTAIALEGIERARAADPAARAVPAIALATAHPAKFPDVVARAVADARPCHPSLAALRRGPTLVRSLPATSGALAEALRRLAGEESFTPEPRSGTPQPPPGDSA